MSAQASQARVEANRRNAQRSTGPRTAEGKARSSRNALTHGLLSESSPGLSNSRNAAIGPVTDPNHAALVTALTAEFQPSGTIETALVATLAGLRHRLNRITAIESGLFENSMTSILEHHAEFAAPGQKTINDCLDAPMPCLLAEAYGRQSRALNLLTFYEARLNREFHRTLAELRRTQALRLASSPEAQLQETAATAIKVEPIPAEQCPATLKPSIRDTTKSTIAASTPEKEQTNPTAAQTSEITEAFHPEAYAAADKGQGNEQGL